MCPQKASARALRTLGPTEYRAGGWLGDSLCAFCFPNHGFASAHALEADASARACQGPHVLLPV